MCKDKRSVRHSSHSHDFFLSDRKFILPFMLWFLGSMRNSVFICLIYEEISFSPGFLVSLLYFLISSSPRDFGLTQSLLLSSDLDGYGS